MVGCLLALLCWTLSSAAPLHTAECELTTGRTLTIIKSVRFPEPYGPNIDCRYAVKKRSESMCSVTFLFNVLDLNLSPECEEDYLRFEDTGEKLCGAKPVGFSRTLSFNASSSHKKKREVVLSFHSGNKTKGGLGYMVTVVQQECPRPSCNSEHSEANFSIASPNYPLPYDNGHGCRYLVHRSSPRICRLALKVKSFDLEEDDHCDADFLLLPHGGKLCGSLQPGLIVEIDFQNDTVTLEFQSDHVITKNGFQLDASQIECVSSTATDLQNVTSAVTTSQPLGNVTSLDNAPNVTMETTTEHP